MVVSLLSTPRTAHTQTLINAGFETPVQGNGNFTYNPTGPGIDWTFLGGSGISGNNSGFTSGTPNAPEGVQVAFLQLLVPLAAGVAARRRRRAG